MEQEENFQAAPDNHLVKAILTLLFCCLPFGIVSLVHATKVEGLWLSGNKASALREADEANKWAKYGIISGLVIYGLYIICVIIAVIAGAY